MTKKRPALIKKHSIYFIFILQKERQHFIQSYKLDTFYKMTQLEEKRRKIQNEKGRGKKKKKRSGLKLNYITMYLLYQENLWPLRSCIMYE